MKPAKDRIAEFDFDIGDHVRVCDDEPNSASTTFVLRDVDPFGIPAASIATRAISFTRALVASSKRAGLEWSRSLSLKSHCVLLRGADGVFVRYANKEPQALRDKSCNPHWCVACGCYHEINALLCCEVSDGIDVQRSD